MIIKSESCKPDVRLSKSVNPVGKPVKASLESYSISIRPTAEVTASLIGTNAAVLLRLATANIFCSATSIVLEISSSSS